MLQSNYSKLITTGSNIGGLSAVSNKFFIKENEWFGVTRISETAGYPEGYGSKSFAMPLKSGSISTLADVDLFASGSGAMGVNGEASTTISVSAGDLVGELIVSGAGSTTLTMTAEGSVVASLNGVGSTTFTINLNHLAMFVDAYGYAIAQLNLLTSGSGTLTGKAICGGSTVDTSGLTPASIWAYGDRTLTALDVEVSGLTVEQANQLTSIANNTGLIPALL